MGMRLMRMCEECKKGLVINETLQCPGMKVGVGIQVLRR
jgi:hypothetical protein